jgi:hypothetical protein
MPPRTTKQILSEWHELAVQREEASDSELADAIAARIEQVRREYIEGEPPEDRTGGSAIAADDEAKIQMKLPL